MNLIVFARAAYKLGDAVVFIIKIIKFFAKK